MNCKRSFTLLETMISLLVVTLVLSISMFSAGNFHNYKAEEELFWKSFQHNLEFYEHLSVKHHAYVIISIGSDRINFNSTYLKDNIIHQLSVPKSLSINKSHTITIGNDGYISPQTIRWYSSNYHQYFRQIFQMGWGVYRVVPENQ